MEIQTAVNNLVRKMARTGAWALRTRPSRGAAGQAGQAVLGEVGTLSRANRSRAMIGGKRLSLEHVECRTGEVILF